VSQFFDEEPDTKSSLGAASGNPVRPPRVLIPFWIQLFGSFLLILALVGGMFAFAWPHVERRVFSLSRVYIAMSSAQSAAQFFDSEIIYNTPTDVDSRVASPEMRRLQRLYGAGAVAVDQDRSETKPKDAETTTTIQAPGLRVALAPGASRKITPEEQLDVLMYDGDFSEFVLEFSLVVPTPNGWVVWLSSDSALVGKPFQQGNYLDAYMRPGGGWDNFLNEVGLFTVFAEDDREEVERIEAERSVKDNPPRLGLNASRDPIISVRPITSTIDLTRLPERTQATGADFSRAAIVAEYPRERILAPSFLLKLIFFAVLILATLAALIVAVFLTIRMNRPIRKLHEAMLSVAAGDQRVRIEGVRSRDELGRLAWQFNEMMAELEGSRQLTADVTLAAKIQRSLVPDPPTDIPSLDIAAWYAPSAIVSGDYYDFIRKGNHVFLTIGDAVGHGVDSGIIMATARAMLRSIIENEESPGKILTTLNRLLCQDFKDGNFLTCAIMRFDLEEGLATISSAGHEPVLHVSGMVRTARVIRANNPPLGLLEEHRYKDAPPIEMNASDVLILSSDGIRECHDPDSELFGMDRYLATISQQADDAAATVEMIQKALLTHARGRPLDDDVSLVVVRSVKGMPSAQCGRRPAQLFRF
jgi:serine phosphatase RsbU (regulator of sigma subunit)